MPSLYAARILPFSAALQYHAAAAAGSRRTSVPKRYLSPRSHWAAASPASAACFNRSSACPDDSSSLAPAEQARATMRAQHAVDLMDMTRRMKKRNTRVATLSGPLFRPDHDVARGVVGRFEKWQHFARAVDHVDVHLHAAQVAECAALVADDRLSQIGAMHHRRR